MPTIKLILKTRQNPNGERAILLYVNRKGWKKATRISCGINVLSEKWDPVGQKIKGRGEAVNKLNLVLHQKRSLAADILSDYALMKRDISQAKFKTEFHQPHLRRDFLAFWKKKMEEGYDRRLFGESNLMGEKRSLRKISEYSGNQLAFSELTRTWLEEFDRWHAKAMEKTRHKGVTERARVLKHIKKYLDKALSEMDGIKIAYPFKGFKMPSAKSNPVSLEESELILLIKIYRDPEYILERMSQIARDKEMAEWHVAQYAHSGGVARIQRVLRKFLYQCLTGMRYSDMINLEFRDVEGKYMTFVPQKTKESSGKIVRVLLTKKMKELIGKGSSGKIFKTISNIKYNQYLKEVADIAKIDKRLTSHVGRHTFATIGIQKGIPLPILIDLMGLSSVRTLMKYVHTNQSMRDEYMQKVFGEIE